MASPAADAGDAAPAPKKGKTLIVLIAVAVLMLCVGGGGAWFFMHKKGGGEHAEAKPKKSAPPVFLSMEPFVVNLAGDAQHYLQIGMDLKLADSHVIDDIKLHLPEIRNGVLLLLSAKKVEDLVSVEQKNQMRAEIREVINKPLGIHTPAPKPKVVPAEGAEGVGEAHAAEEKTEHKAAEEKTEHKEKEGEEKGHEESGEHGKGGGDEGVIEVLLTSFVIQ